MTRIESKSVATAARLVTAVGSKVEREICHLS